MANLSALLDKEASAEIETLLTKAREQAAEIISAAKAEAETLTAQRRRAAEGQHAASLVRSQSSAQLAAASLRLNAQHQAVESVFGKVRAELDALRDNAQTYRSVLARLLEEAITAFPDGAVNTVLVNPADLALAKEVAAERGLAEKVQGDASVGAGVRLRGSDNISVENTLGQRLDALRDELASHVSGVLFGTEA